MHCQKCSEMVSFGGEWRVPASGAVNNLTLSFYYKLQTHSNKTSSRHLSTFRKWRSRTRKTKSRSTGTRPSSTRNLSLHPSVLRVKSARHHCYKLIKACPAHPPLLPHVLLACKGPILDPWHGHCVADKDSIFVGLNKGFVLLHL